MLRWFWRATRSSFRETLSWFEYDGQVRKERRERRRSKQSALMRLRTYRPIHLATLIALTSIALAVTGLTAWLMWDAAQVPAKLVTSPDLAVRTAQLRVDVIRNILAVGAGTGGLIALFLALRRQYVKERVDYADQEHKNRTAEDSRHDATERRVTDLYVKAAEQLGSGNAAVRMAALYALERLGQGNVEHRQTVVSLICAYLRMPFTPPTVRQPAVVTVEEGKVRLDLNHDIPVLSDEEVARRHELEVRVTAQRILSEHLKYTGFTGEADRPEVVGPSSLWAGIDVDLTGAVLVDLKFGRCAVRSIRMSDVRFVGSSDFHGLFAGLYANFMRARFNGFANFDWANLGLPSFNGAVFRGGATFENARFAGDTSFGNAEFRGDMNFSGISGARPSFGAAKALLEGLHVWPSGYDLMRNNHDPEMGDLTWVGQDLGKVDPEQRFRLRFPPPPTGRVPVDPPPDPDPEG